jgi:hypothetical protein
MVATAPRLILRSDWHGTRVACLFHMAIRNSSTTRKADDDSSRTEDRGVESAKHGSHPVARRAYELFEARGSEDGRDQEDWFEAERELKDRSSE